MTQAKRDAVNQPRASSDDLALARSLLAEQAAAIGSVAERLGEPFVQAVGLIERCVRSRGTVLVSGLGKSGLIGAKIAATHASMGIPSHFIHPTEAAHGDLGNFRDEDVCIAISYSGETDEVISLASALKQDGIDVIAMCAGKTGASGLEKVATVTLALGNVEDDLSPAPMCSTTATLALGDALALCASRRLGFSASDFNKRHPGGSLGGLTKPVVEALRFKVGVNLHPARDDLTVADALHAADVDGRRPGALLLVDAHGRLSGLFTDGDLRRQVLSDPNLLTRPIREVMTKNPSTLRDDALLRDAVRVVQQWRRDEIPVVDADGKPVGMLDVQDLITMRVVKP